MEFNIKFRAFCLEDALFINNLRNDERMEALIGGSKRKVALMREQKWVEDIMMGDSQSATYFAITEKDSEQIIGYTSISDIDYRNGTCFWSGIKLSREMSGRGYGLQVSLLVSKIVFEEMRMVRCIGMCQESHVVAKKLMEKAGYQTEGLMRKYVYKNGVHINTYLMSITDEDYVSIKTKYSL